MKNKLFPIFITLLGLLTAYAFYAFWHTEELDPALEPTKTKEKIVEDLSNKEIIPKKSFNEKNLNENRLVVPEASLVTHSQSTDEKMILEEMEKDVDIPNLTPQQMEAKTQAVYDELTPEDHEETMEEAAIAFETLDEHVAQLDAQLAQEEQDVEESMSSDIETAPEEMMEEDTEALETLEEEEIDMEQEDVNNP